MSLFDPHFVGGTANGGPSRHLSRHFVLAAAAALACTLMVIAAGCAHDSDVGVGSQPELPAFSRDPSAEYDTGLATVTLLASSPNAVLAADVDAAAVTLLTREGEVLWHKEFAPMQIASAQLSSDGERVFVSLVSAGGPGAQAIILAADGSQIWERSAPTIMGFWEAYFSADGASAVVFAVPAMPESTGQNVFEILSRDGETLTSIEPTAAPVFALSASEDLRHVVVSFVSQASSDEHEQLDTTVVHYADGVAVDTSHSESSQVLATVSHDGERVLQVRDGADLSMRDWDGELLWTTEAEFTGLSQFSDNDELILLMGLTSSQSGLDGLARYTSTLDILDADTGASVWSGSVDSASLSFPFVTRDFSRIALVPALPTDVAVLLTRSGGQWETESLPTGTTAVCFDDDGTMFTGGDAGLIAVY